MEPGTCGSVVRNSNHWTPEQVEDRNHMQKINSSQNYVKHFKATGSNVVTTSDNGNMTP
jgi:hypothetical protein